MALSGRWHIHLPSNTNTYGGISYCLNSIARVVAELLRLNTKLLPHEKEGIALFQVLDMKVTIFSVCKESQAKYF